MRDPIYNIWQFEYSKSADAFVAEEESLHTESNNYKVSFPNQGKQFFIRNEKSGGFRRFRLLFQNKIKFVFTSCDNIACVIYKKKENVQ